MRSDIYIVSATRTAIGGFGGSLKDIAPCELGGAVISEAVRRSGVDPAAVGHVVMGHVIPTEPRDAYLSRAAALQAGLPQDVPAFNVNRLCGSGLQAVVSASQLLAMGDADVAIAGGAESMSRGLYMLNAARWGARMGDTQAVDFMLGVLHDPVHRIHMGLTAEHVAEKEGITRHMQDEAASESHARAARAMERGYFEQQICAVEVKARHGTQTFERDEHVKPGTSVEQLSKMKPVFKSDGTVTAGNASGLNDAAAALVMATDQGLKNGRMRPMARVVSYGLAGVDPRLMGLGPVPASRLALQRAGLRTDALDVVESNEAFAAQACAVTRALELDPRKVNPNGSGISLGHPVGATGAILVTKAVYELHRIQGRYALVTMCIGGGQGIALIIERV